jgi:hypothetical protein
MKRSRFTEERIIGILREQEAAVAVTELCGKRKVRVDADGWPVLTAELWPAPGTGHSKFRLRVTNPRWMKTVRSFRVG